MGHEDLSRRDFVRTGATAGAGAVLLGPAGVAGAARRPTRLRAQVAVLGGGMAGLTAAHELAERGFGVTVFEPTALGGKARSIPAPGTAQGGRRPLPGEHGFRFFPGFYHHVPDTMRRIPVAGNPGGVRDNLVDAPMAVLSRTGGEDIATPFGFSSGTLAAYNPQNGSESLVGALKLLTDIPANEMAVFLQRLSVFLTSCDERRYGQWEKTSWKTFIKAEGKSAGYQEILAKGLTRALVAAKEEIASARTIGNMAEAFVANLTGRGNDGSPDRVLDGPTNEVWIDPWIVHLRKLGVRFRVGYTVESLNLSGGRVASAQVRDKRGRRYRVDADWFVSAMPAERAVKLWNRKVLAVDPHLAEMRGLFVDWMVGIQYFLKREAPLTAGHMAYMSSPWAVTSINQAQFWDERNVSRDYGDGTVKDILSCDVSDWDAPGILFGKPAKRCSREEIAKEVWAQIKASVNDTGAEKLRDADLHSWFLDPGVSWSPRLGRNVNRTPLLVNTVNSWEKRPKAVTRIPNLFLSGDYVQTDIDLATMEGANESARAAVNGLLDAAGSNATRAKMYRLYDLPEFAVARAEDRRRYAAGQRNLLDT